MGGEQQQPPGTPEHVFEDYRARRDGLVRALTTEVDKLYEQCDPERENLCLYGFPDGSWEVQLPADEVPPELPEPALGINFARDGMRRNDWLALVAVHSDAWLMAVAFYYGAKFGPSDREKLFSLINQVPTVFEEQSGRATQPGKKRGTAATTTATNAQAAAPAPAAAAVAMPKQKSRVAELLEELGTTACVAQRSPGEIMYLPSNAEEYREKLQEKKVELMWPDDGYWYRAVVAEVRPKERQAFVYYVGGEYEDMNLDEVAAEGHINIISEQ